MQAWRHLNHEQREAVALLNTFGPCDLEAEVGSQLEALGMAHALLIGGYCISQLGRAEAAARARSPSVGALASYPYEVVCGRGLSHTPARF